MEVSITAVYLSLECRINKRSERNTHTHTRVEKIGEMAVKAEAGVEWDGTNSLLDTSSSEKSVWLLKVPPLVGHSWQQQPETGSHLAKVIMSMDPLNPNPTADLQVPSRVFS